LYLHHPSAGFSDTDYGCQRFMDSAKDVSFKIADEISSRMQSMFDSSTITTDKMTRLLKFWKRMDTRAVDKRQMKYCGPSSRLGFQKYYSGKIYNMFNSKFIVKMSRNFYSLCQMTVVLLNLFVMK
jgi:hypothetical protein